MTTWLEFVEAVTEVDVSGVNRTYVHPPTSLATADLPAKFPIAPTTIGEHQKLLDGTVIVKQVTVTLAVATEAVGQALEMTKFSESLKMGQRLDVALAALAAGRTDLIHSVTLRDANDPIIVGGSAYYGVTAEVTGAI